MKTAAELRLGLIGCGGIGSLRAAAIRRAPFARLVAVSDLDPARAQATAAGTGAAVEADWQDLVRRSDLDAVLVCTPPSLHLPMGLAALEAGKHVLCEKPLARSTRECGQLVQAAEQAGRCLATGFNYRFYPSIAKARELFDAGLIGELDHIRAYTGYSAQEHDHAWIHDVGMMGGGAFRDNGVHLLDTVCYFLGDVIEVKGFTSEQVWQYSGCEDNGFALLRNAGGKIASVHASWTEWDRYRFRVEIYGTRGCLRATCFPMLTHAAWFHELGGRKHRRTYYFPRVQLGEKLWSYRWIVIKSFVAELHAWLRAIRGEPSPIATGQDGLRTVAVAEAAIDQHPRMAPALMPVEQTA